MSRICLLLFQIVFLLIALSDAEAGWAEENWRLIAKSSLIVTGKLSVPKSAFDNIEERLPDLAAGYENPDKSPYVKLTVGISSVLKGKPEGNSICFYYFLNEEKYGGVTRKKVISFHGMEVTVFLVYASGGWHGGGYYLKGYTPDSLQIASQSLNGQIISEVKSQNALAEQLDKSPPEDTESEPMVTACIEKFFDEKKAEASYYFLILLGQNAVPSVIRHMDDRRMLKVREITLPAGPQNKSESLVHYGPKTVTDVLSIILGKITGESFGAIYNGGSERERASAVFGWKVWLAKERKKGLR